MFVLAYGLAATSGCQRSRSPRALDLDGDEVEPLRDLQGPTVVLFLTTTCPISNRYAPTLAGLATTFSGTSWVRAYPSRLDSVDDIETHTVEYALPGKALRDHRHELVATAKARVTPQASVFVPASGSTARLVYSGRIDDRAVDFGHFRPKPKQRDLHDMLARIDAGDVPDTPTRNEAVGCYIADLR